MDIMNKFFIEVPNLIGMLYIIMGVSALGTFIFNFLPVFLSVLPVPAIMIIFGFYGKSILLKK